MSVKESVKQLQALQAIDTEVLELQRAGEAHPKRLAELDAELAAARSKLEAERTRLSDNERLRREKETEVQSEKEKIKKWEARLAEQRTTREYAALAREIDIAKKAVLTLEDEYKAMLAQAEEVKRLLADRQAEYARREDGSAAERAQLAQQIAALSGQVGELTEKRNEMAKDIDPGLCGRYDSVRRKRGTGLAAVTNGVCKGCHMRAPPQLQNILRAGVIESCPSCQRLIYADELFAQEPQ